MNDNAKKTRTTRTPTVIFIYCATIGGLVPACGNRGRGTTNRTVDRRPPEPPPRPQPPPVAKDGFVSPEKLAAALKGCAEKVAPRCLVNLVNVKASLTMEAVRRMAAAEGTWSPPESGSETGPKARASALKWARNAFKPGRRAIMKRRELLDKVAVAILASPKGPPGTCTTTQKKDPPLLRLLKADLWAKPSREATAKLMNPWGPTATVTVACTGLTLEATVIMGRRTKKWVLAELVKTPIRAHFWQYERLVPPDPFARTAPLPATAAKLFAALGKCLKTRDPRCLAAHVKVWAMVAYLFTEQLLEAPPQKRSDLVKKHAGQRWKQNEAPARLHVWRRLLGLIHGVKADFASCRLTVAGRDELAMTRKRYRADLKKQGIPAPTRWFLGRALGLRTACYTCGSARIYLTGAKLATGKRSGWTLINFTAEQHSGPPGHTP